MPEPKHTDRRDAMLSIVRAGAAGIGIAALLSGCSTAAERRVKARGGSFGEPIPEDPILVNRPWTPDRNAVAVRPGTMTDAVPAGVYTRQQWAKGDPKPWLADPMGTVRRITVHHDAIDTAATGAPAQIAARLDSIRRSHLARGWADIGYHYAIDAEGRVWQGRPLSLQGAHVADQNQNNLGIVLLGNFERQTPSPKAVESLDRLIATEMRRFGVSLTEIRTHREMAPTACPGRNLQRAMDATRTRGGRLASLAAGDFRG